MRPQPALHALIATAYDAQLRSSAHLIDRLRFTDSFTEDCGDVPSGALDLASRLFQLHLKRYLSAPGHVYDVEMAATSLLTPEEIEAERDNATLRGELFLEATCASRIPPIGDQWDITVRL